MSLHCWIPELFYAVLLCVFFTGQCHAGSEDQTPTKVLFIGNSYIFMNDLPQVFERLAKAGGHPVEVGMVAPGGWTLLNHAQSSETLAEIGRQSWDYVVLQEQSVIPSVPSEREGMSEGARILHQAIKDRGARTVFFLTWGRRDGFPEVGYKNFSEMQGQLNQGYMGIAKELKAMVAPVGMAWQEALAQDNSLELWQSDGSHPSGQGSYLAACVFYATIFQQSPEGVSYHEGLSKRSALLLQKIAAGITLDNPSRWNLP